MTQNYKKLLGIFILMLMFLPWGVHQLQASALLAEIQQQDNILTLGAVMAAPDTVGTVDISLDNIDSVASAQIVFSYDTINGIQFTGVSTTDRTTDYQTNFSENQSGTTVNVTILLFNFVGTTIAPGSGSILELNFEAGSSANATTPLNLSTVLLSDSNGGVLPASGVVDESTPTDTHTPTDMPTPTDTPTLPEDTPTVTPPIDGAIVSIDPISTTIAQTSIFTVAVNITTQEPVYGYQINCEFDPNILQHIETFDGTPFVDVVNGGFLIPDLTVREEVDNIAGTLSYAISLKGEDNLGSQGSGTLIQLPFYGLSPGTSPVNCTNIQLSNASVEAIPVTFTGGEITVSDSLDIAFQVQKQLRDTHGGVQACLDDVCQMSNSVGAISFEDFPQTGQIVVTHPQHLSTTFQYTGTAGSIVELPTAYLVVGDLDQDGDIDITDIGIIANAFTSVEEDAHWNALADVTAEGEVDGVPEVNIFDLVGVAKNFNKTAPSPWNYETEVRSAMRQNSVATSSVPIAVADHINITSQADLNTTVALSPTRYRGEELNENFELEIRMDTVEPVQGAHLQIQFDPTKLSIRDCDPRNVSPGVQACIDDFLDVDNRFIVLNDLVEPGVLEIAITQLFPAEPKSGSGRYATVQFTTIGSGTSNIILSKVHLVDGTTPVPQDIPALAVNSATAVPPFYEFLPWVTR